MTTPTELLYLNDPAITSLEVQLAGQRYLEDGNTELIFSRTVFYPQGGGQPSDAGEIVSHTGRMAISRCTREQDGTVIHRGVVSGSFDNGQLCLMKIDTERRFLHCRIHTAGELICAAVERLGYRSEVVGANHFPGESRVILDGVFNETKLQELQPHLQTEVNNLVASDSRVHIFVTSDRDLVGKVCGFVPEYLSSYADIRIVMPIADWGRPCMGTHVERLGLIENVVIGSVKSKKGQTRVSYDVKTLEAGAG